MYRYSEESFLEVIDDIKPLVKDHSEEVDVYQEVVQFNPDYDTYEAMAEMGIIKFYTARAEDGELVGYSVMMVNQNPHYKDHLYGVNDIFYVHPDHRHTEVAPTLLKYTEDKMRELDVSVITMNMKTHQPFESLMDSLEWDKTEIVFTKLLKEV